MGQLSIAYYAFYSVNKIMPENVRNCAQKLGIEKVGAKNVRNCAQKLGIEEVGTPKKSAIADKSWAWKKLEPDRLFPIPQTNIKSH